MIERKYYYNDLIWCIEEIRATTSTWICIIIPSIHNDAYIKSHILFFIFHTRYILDFFFKYTIRLILILYTIDLFNCSIFLKHMTEISEISEVKHRSFQWDKLYSVCKVTCLHPRGLSRNKVISSVVVYEDSPIQLLICEPHFEIWMVNLIRGLTRVACCRSHLSHHQVWLCYTEHWINQVKYTRGHKWWIKNDKNKNVI